MTSNYAPLGTGIQQEAVVYPNEFIAETSSIVKLPGGVVLANGARARDIRAGEILARLTADVVGVGSSGQYIARKSTELAASAADAATSITVKNAHPFAAGDTIVIDDGSNPSDAEVIASIDYATNVITLAGTLSGGTNPLPANSKVSVTASGQGTAVGVAGERFTHPIVRTGLLGRTSLIIEGLLKKSRVYGFDTQAATDLSGTDVIAPEGTLVRINK